jgi:hypothetical protein
MQKAREAGDYTKRYGEVTHPKISMLSSVTLYQSVFHRMYVVSLHRIDKEQKRSMQAGIQGISSHRLMQVISS